MKKNTHPKYQKAKVICVCGNEFEVGSTNKEIKTELCHMCHPFYTGKLKLVDTAHRVEKFTARLAQKDAKAGERKGKKAKREAEAKKKAKKTSEK